MKSNVCILKGANPDIEKVLQEVEKVAEYNGLNSKGTIRLRLLAEELIGMQNGILGFVKGEFYIESKKNTYTFYFHADIKTDSVTRERFVDLSTNNRNVAYKGFAGKIRLVADTLMNDSKEGSFDNYDSYRAADSTGIFNSDLEYDKVWALSQYREEVTKNSAEWDELEKSIVANLADELIIGATKEYVDMIAVKKF
ncbi:MAG: hypothetical protein J6B68_01415 [Lachnospiraceae bacterium]|nr:hypothetical protein [Lachnospiraceae bacterium]